MKLTREAYQKLANDDITWLRSLPHSLERDHVISIVALSVNHEYPLVCATYSAAPSIEQLDAKHDARRAVQIRRGNIQMYKNRLAMPAWAGETDALNRDINECQAEIDELEKKYGPL